MLRWLTGRPKVIYSVVPPEISDDVFHALADHYKDNPNITVIRDRRSGERRTVRGAVGDHGEKRTLRDRRRRKASGADTA
jgi:hypothetical protein